MHSPSRRLALSALIMLSVASATLRAAQEAPIPDPNRKDIHSFANPRQLRVTRVELDLTADFAAKVLRGSAVLRFERSPGTGGSTPLILDTRDLTIERAWAAQGDLAWQEARFSLGKPDKVLGTPLSIALPPGADRVKIAYATSPGAAALQWLDPAQTAGGQKPFLFSQSQAIQARSWIPLQDSPAVRVTYSAAVNVPEGLTAVMSADMKGKGDDGAFRFEMAQAIPSYLIALAIGDLAFRPLGRRTGVYAEPSIVEAAAFEFADTETMVEAVEAKFGPYRWGRYDLLVLPPSFPFGGMENPRLTFLTPTVLAGDRSLVDLIAHELAHSWSGNLVTNATWRDFWLNEGFTTYLERRIVEEVYGADRRAMADVLGIRELRDELGRLAPKDEFLHIDLAGRDPDEGVTQIAYEKGARFLMALEAGFGRQAFDAYLRGYFDRFAFRSITTADFEADLRENLFAKNPGAAKAIDLHAWIHSPGLPAIEPEPASPRLAEAEAAARRWAGGAPAAQIDTAGWTTQEWLYFLRSLPEKVPAKRLDDLDAAFGLTDRKNAEVAQQWLLLAVRSGSADPRVAKRLDDFLTTIGRRKYLMPLYGALAKTPAGKARALEIYAKARPRYHPLTDDSVGKMLGSP